jgi:hypothetical protein
MSSVNASNATPTRWYLSFHCCSFDVEGSPNGYGIDIVGTILFAPTVVATGIKLHIKTIGIPALSISFTIVAPQRVQVPQVDVIITPSTLSSINFATISLPILDASA